MLKVREQYNYGKIINSGGKLQSGHDVAGKKTMAELTRATFIALGFDSTKIVVIKADTAITDGTYNSGLSIKNWFLSHQIKNRIKKLNFLFNSKIQ